MTIATNLERLALGDSIVVGGQPVLGCGAERAEQRLQLATGACAQDRLACRLARRLTPRLAPRRVLDLDCRLTRTKGEEDESAEGAWEEEDSEVDAFQVARF